MIREYPFTKVCGQEKAKRALLAACLNPAAGGILLLGEKGCAKSVLCYSLKDLFCRRKFTVIPLNVTAANLAGDTDTGAMLREGKIRKEKGLLDKLAPKLQQAAKAREENPEATLTELAEMMEPAITKPAMNNRMKRLVQLAKEQKL